MMLEATACNFVHVIDSAAGTEPFARSSIGRSLGVDMPIQVDVRIRSDKGVSSMVATPAASISVRDHLVVGTLLDCYM